MVGALGSFFAVADRLRWFGRQTQKPEPEEILAKADMARDGRIWTKARKLYAEYLARNPADAAIWVQYGHSLKEFGDLESAEKAYRRSLTLASGVRRHLPAARTPFEASGEQSSRRLPCFAARLNSIRPWSNFKRFWTASLSWGSARNGLQARHRLFESLTWTAPQMPF